MSPSHDTNSKDTKAKDAKLSKWLLPVILVAGLILFFASGLHQWLSFEKLALHYGTIKIFIADNPLASFALFFALYAIAVAFSLPIASLLTLGGGALLGWPAAIIIVLAATSGACVVFIAAKTILASTLTSKAGPFLAKLEAGFRENSFQYLLALRLVPAAPFWVVNIVPALVGMRLSSYALATLIGIIPGTFVYVYVAQGFDHILSQGRAPDLSNLADWQIIGPLAALGALALLPVIIKKIKAKATPAKDTPAKDKGASK